VIHKQRWTVEKIRQRLGLISPLVYRRQTAVPPFRFRALAGPTDPAAVSALHDDPAAWPIIEPYSYWGSWMTDFVLRTQITVPAEWDPAAPVALYLPIGDAGDFSHPEALAYLDGAAYATVDRHHQEFALPATLREGRPHDLALHGWTGLGDLLDGNPYTKLFMRPVQVVEIDQPTRDFVAAARTALGVAMALDANEPVRGRLLNGLDDAFKRLDTREPFGDAFYVSVPAAHDALRTAVADAGPSLDVCIHAAGHAHIDVAWLWTLGQTRRKAERTFQTVIRLMEQFPDYKFTQSQPQLYDFVRQDQPALFEDIRQRVRDGRWEPIGGMWVEADCNLSGGESLARQFLLGRTFFREQFGPDAESPVLWLPDVFGYAWNLPQLIKEAGLEYFFTIKIGWSQYNRMPYDSFWWQGLDGTRVLTHFSPTKEAGDHFISTYNAHADAAETFSTWTNFQQKEQSQDLLMAFGYGDGGGGPTLEMLENIREMAAYPATPQIRHAKAIDFFRTLEISSGQQLPVWNGELYLEYHRGTYTTHARNKRANRRSEFLLHNADFLAVYATQTAGLDTATHKAALARAWQLVCLNQFHDIIPGTSITPVYVESQAQYAEVQALAEEVIVTSLAAVAGGDGATTLVANANSGPWRGPIFVPGPVRSPDRAQPAEGGYWLDPGQLPPYSVGPLPPGRPAQPGLSASPGHLENTHLRVEFNAAGDITRLYDKDAAREVLPDGAIANQFQAFEDRPMEWDAWDIEIYYDDKLWLADPAESVTVVEHGPLRVTLEVRRRILNSPITQRISLTHDGRRLDFETDISWQERHTLLKVAFPAAVLTPRATYEVQWGHVERPTHRNTSWDWARFETAAQKWVDVSEGDYGVSLLNDCKYGHDIRDAAPNGAVMRLSLLRSSTRPDPTADTGDHHFTYSLLPHIGPLGAMTIAEAYALNNPPIVYGDGPPGPSVPAVPFITTDRDNVVIETIKAAEDGRGVIVRLYESQRQRGPVTLRTAFPLATAWQTNLLEEAQGELAVDGHTVQLTLRPFQIVTLRLLPEEG
jgi:alpha-mannosidase